MRTEKKIAELLKKDPSIPADSAIYLRHIAFGYEENTLVLKDLNVDIKKGESVSIIGHNGSGKSTMAKLIDGILVQNSGDIFINGVLMTDDNALLLRKDVGLVFQNPDAQFIGATVRDDIAFGLENNCVDPKKMDEIIHRCSKAVGMEDYLDAEPSNLSGGQKQRVAIAGMIARKPKILILDEAGAMLDPKGKREIRDIIATRKKENPDMTILTITHEIEDAYDADRVIVINDGKAVYSDTPAEVFSHDDFLKSISLDVPFAHALAKLLKEGGLDLGKVNNDKELLAKLCPSD